MSRHENADGLGGGASATATPPVAAPFAAARRGRLKLAAAALGAAAVIGVIWGGAYWWTTGRFLVSTDDAYVRADMTLLAAKVSGYVTEVLVENNQSVKAGDIIARIDDGDYRIALEAARAREKTQEAALERISRQIEAARAAVAQAAAQVPAAEADLARASSELERQVRLAQRDFASQQKLELARADRARAEAALLSAKAALQSARANVQVLEAQKAEAAGVLNEYRKATARAERDLSFTEVRAPVSGVIGNKAVQTGQFVQPGARLAAIVPLDDVYIDANFKETQISRLHPGQKVTFTVDAYPDRLFHGVVASLSPASGALFSLLPPDNATGNFTKIVQRLPVRLLIDRQEVAEHVLRPGLSVVATVDTRTGPAPGEAAAKE
ncbi:HlyD family secretion protein [Camelimonas abortus]|uniref:HlyD family secretion protein n=1 Tax=Camelimonas abortus TaxID=1017184 RepID=A0ABV7LH13_9HYPH